MLAATAAAAFGTVISILDDESSSRIQFAMFGRVSNHCDERFSVPLESCHPVEMSYLSSQ